MRTVHEFPRPVRELENVWIPLPDGCRLAARIWLPADAEGDPVPAILEYLPYRKRDGTSTRDCLTHPYFAGHGYAGVRVDMRGNGEADGLMYDEYLPREQADCLAVIDWLCAQTWCSGAVGMMGISWGGFNGLQVAFLRPSALKAVITLCSTDDRYADDIHYKGGCLLNENLGWAAEMLAFSSRPPDPLLVGERWRAMWRERLEAMPLLIDPWLSHQHRDAYWKHGSICEDYGAVQAAVLAVGGWGDAYTNAVGRMLEHLPGARLGIVGPWVHKYPHFAVPGPRIGFLQEALAFWDRYLKDRDTGMDRQPRLRAYLMDSVRPATSYAHRPGRWVSEADWPSPDIQTRAWHLAPGRLGDTPVTAELEHCSSQTVGLATGEYCAMWLGPEWPADQRADDALSLCFDSAPLEERLEILGAPELTLSLSVDRPRAFLAVRLCDVHPDGASTRVSYGILNLCHRDGHEHPAELEPGRRYTVRVRLDDVGYAFPPGHRLRVAVSTCYWPLIWPSPAPVTLRVETSESRLTLPVRPPREEPEVDFPAPEAAPPEASTVLRAGHHHRTVSQDLATGETTLTIDADFGEARIDSHGLTSGSSAREVYRIHPDEPLCARAELHWTITLSRGHWSVRTESYSLMWSDAGHFHVHARLDAFEGERRVYSREWDRSIPRECL